MAGGGVEPWRLVGQYWRHVGLPVLLPSLLAAFVLLFGNAFSAYATPYALTSGNIGLVPIEISNVLSGNVTLAPQVGAALAAGMIAVMAVVLGLYWLANRGGAVARKRGALRRHAAKRAQRRSRPAASELPLRRGRVRFGFGGWITIVLAALYFLAPLVITGAFSLWEGGSRYGFAAYRDLIGDHADAGRACCCRSSLRSRPIALGMVLLVPAMIFVHLRAPRLRTAVRVHRRPALRGAGDRAGRRADHPLHRAGLADRHARTTSSSRISSWPCPMATARSTSGSPRSTCAR